MRRWRVESKWRRRRDRSREEERRWASGWMELAQASTHHQAGRTASATLRLLCRRGTLGAASRRHSSNYQAARSFVVLSRLPRGTAYRCTATNSVHLATFRCSCFSGNSTAKLGCRIFELLLIRRPLSLFDSFAICRESTKS